MLLKRPLILMDIDETILDRSYRPTHDSLANEVREMAHAGWLLGLNSSTTIQRANTYAIDWACNGPLVVECGAAIYDKPFSPTYPVPPAQWPSSDPWIMHFDAIMRDFLLYLHVAHSDLFVFVGDTRIGFDCISRLPEINKPWVIVSGFRRRTLCFFVRERAPDGSLRTNLALLNTLAEKTCEIFRQNTGRTIEGPLCDVNPAYGICILYRPGASKRHAIPYLLEHYDPIVMIGNSMSDHLADKRVFQCAVANADPKYTALCRYVSPLSLTLGAIDCLKWIRQESPLR